MRLIIIWTKIAEIIFAESNMKLLRLLMAAAMISAAAVSVQGCNSIMSKDECINANWDSRGESDGIAGKATQRVLYHSGSAISYAALRDGDTGSAVRNLQYTLYELGYYDGSIDGDYGQTTSDAVRAFQIMNKLTPVDGVAGSATLGRLYSSDAVPASAADVSYDTIGPGSKGDDVLQVQDCLIDLGYLQRTTGTYDDATIEAVKAFQRDNGLTADGLAGKRTLELLFGY